MKDEKKEAVELILGNRMFLYSLMHKVFGREPDTQLLELLTADHTGEAFRLLSEEEGDILDRVPEELNRLKEAMAAADFLDEVRSDYTRLFIGPFSLAAPPWESVYGQQDALLFQESTLEVRSTYRRFGLIPEAYPHVADDSLALELHFMALLAQRSYEEFDSGRKEDLFISLRGSSDFLKKHLLIWIPKFLDRMQSADASPMYPRLCIILNEFLKQDSKLLTEVLDELNERSGS
ncbi:MAG: molecular chaperone TorD family protein [Oscillospiraceae bacterium]|nr:molecular chaperone TorD family protein [Oscillospiraceae bacterium]